MVLCISSSLQLVSSLGFFLDWVSGLVRSKISSPLKRSTLHQVTLLWPTGDVYLLLDISSLLDSPAVSSCTWIWIRLMNTSTRDATGMLRSASRESISVMTLMIAESTTKISSRVSGLERLLVLLVCHSRRPAITRNTG